jgi:transposase
MKKFGLDDQQVLRVAVQQEVVHSSECRYQHRLTALLLVSSGKSCQEVASLFGENRRTIQRWVKKYATEGLDALHDAKRDGRPATLNAQQWNELKRDFVKGTPVFGNGPGRRHAKFLAQHLNSKYGVCLGLRQCQRIFRVLIEAMKK